MLFIVPYPLGVAPSQRFRFEQYLDLLARNKINYKIASFWSKRAWSVLYKDGSISVKVLEFIAGVFRRFLLLFQSRQYQFVFIHREALPIGPPIIEFMLSKVLRRKIIYDFDDAIWLPNTSSQNIIARKLKYHRKVRTICKWSWKVSCGNDFLADYAKKYNPNTFINPTTIDLQYHKPITDKKDKMLTIGWTGTHSTIKYLESLMPVLNELRNSFPISIIIISDHAPRWVDESLEFVKWNKADEIKQLDRIDIGIMPLNESEWERGKCGFKALQYMAMRKPAVISDVGVNSQIVDHNENGFLCQNAEEFKKYLSLLINDSNLRKTMGDKARKKVEKFYSTVSNSTSFLSLFI